jgi:hypothetical protein
MSAVDGHDLSAEVWREYEWPDGLGQLRTYRIDDPRTLFRGVSTHRVLDHAGIVHLVPEPGRLGCVLRWCPRDPAAPVQF